MRSLRRLVLALTVLAGATLIAFGATRLVRAATGSSVVRTRHLIGSAAPLPRLYAASSPFNRPIPADAPVDAQSDLLVHSLVEALDPDRQWQAAQQATGKDAPSSQDVAAAARTLLDAAVEPLATNPKFREMLVEVRRSYEQAIDEVSKDAVVEAGYSADATERAKATVRSFRQFIEEHKDEITALQILYSHPYKRRLTFEEIRDLAHTIAKPPYILTPEKLWQAYRTLEKSRVRGGGGRVLTDLVSLVRFELQQENELVPFADVVRQRFEAWLERHEAAGRRFTHEQRQWLEAIRDHIATSLGIARDDFEYIPFVERGGLGKAASLFGEDLDRLLEEMTEALAA